MLKLPVKSPIVNENIDLSEYAKKSDVDAIDASLDNKAEKKDVEKLSSQLDTMATKEELDVERKRIDNLSSLGEGSTTGDAELIDARVSQSGLVFSNVGYNSFKVSTISLNAFFWSSVGFIPCFKPFWKSSIFLINSSYSLLVLIIPCFCKSVFYSQKIFL